MVLQLGNTKLFFKLMISLDAEQRCISPLCQNTSLSDAIRYHTLVP